MAVLTQSNSVLDQLVHRAKAYAAQYEETRAKHKLFRQTVRELGNLTNRELADLGIDRSMITSIAHDAAYGEN
ncbi:MAG: DUF1127 domain-containing protein [Ruegeria sp.]